MYFDGSYTLKGEIAGVVLILAKGDIFESCLEGVNRQSNLKHT
jgi:hypothetical protein